MYVHTVMYVCTCTHHISEVVACLSTHNAHGVAKSGDVVDIGVQGLGTGVYEHVYKRGHKLISTGWTIPRYPQSRCRTICRTLPNFSDAEMKKTKTKQYKT